MPLKIHLIIITSIIAALFFGWQILANYSGGHAPAVQLTDGSAETYIRIVRASWGLNCTGNRNVTNSNTAVKGDYTFDKSSKKRPQENNLMSQARQICEGKKRCIIPNNPDQIGFDPDRECYNKLMEIEYRCFSFDRLWKLEIPAYKSGEIDCTDSDAP